MAKTIKKVVKYRDAGTGEYITKQKADKNPKEAVREVDKIVVKKIKKN